MLPLCSFLQTLVNHILTNKQGLKIAVIENEFGERSPDGWGRGWRKVAMGKGGERGHLCA